MKNKYLKILDSTLGTARVKLWSVHMSCCDVSQQVSELNSFFREDLSSPCFLKNANLIMSINIVQIYDCCTVMSL